MAKKNLSNLMSGMISGPVCSSDQISAEPQLQNISAESFHEDMPVRRGRPKKTTSSDQDVRTTIILNKSQLNKLKYAAMVENKPMKEILASLIDKYLSDWERKHGSFPEHIQV